MKKLLSTALLACLLLSLYSFLGGVHAATPVNGVIASDTVWRQSGSPYQFTGPVSVKNGVTLTIEPGTTVNFGDYYLQVNGTLHAQGTQQKPIRITTDNSPKNPLQQIQFMPSSKGWDNQTGLGCLVENVIFNKVSLNNRGCSSLKIVNNVFNGPYWEAVYSSTGALTITGNNITDCLMSGLQVYGSSIISNNIIKGTGSQTAVAASGDCVVSNNMISNFQIGISVGDRVSVKSNVIENCSDSAISVSGGSVTIEGNYVTGNGVGIKGSGSIRNNAIVNNMVGIKLSRPSTVTENNIVDNSLNSLALESPDNVDAANNWWGITDPQAISESIYDYEDDFNVGTANFKPFLTGPVTSAPTGDFNQNVPSGNNFFDIPYDVPYDIQADIIAIAQMVVVGLVVVWLVIALVFIARRGRRIKISVKY